MLHLTIADPNAEGVSYREFDVHGPEGLTGRLLARALDDAGDVGGLSWHVGDAPLRGLGELPSEGHLYIQRHAAADFGLAVDAPVFLLVDEGPDAGLTRPLTRGVHTLGRGSCDVRVADPAMSRHHAELVVDTTSITLVDEGSANGSRVGGASVRHRRLAAGDTFLLGQTTFRIATPAGPPARVTWPIEPLLVDGAPSGSRPWLMLLGAVLPLGIGIALALTLGSWYFLAFSALGLVTGGVPALADLGRRRRFTRRVRKAVQLDVARTEDAAPTPGAISASLRLPTNRSDHRHAAPAHSPEGVLLRLGRGRGRPAVAFPGAAARPVTPPDQAPVVVELLPGTCGQVGGPRAAAAGVLRAMVLQLASAAASGGPELWIAGPWPELPAALRRVPGVRCLGSPEELAAATADHRDFVVVLLPAPDPVWTGATSGPGTEPALVLCGAHDRVAASWRVDPINAKSFEADGERPVQVDRMSFRTLAGLAARLADRSGAAGGRTGPRQPGECTFRRPPTPWTESSASHLSTPVGRSGSGEMVFDLVRDGPHLLVAGTTGSGKSEFLKALVLGLACRYEPAELSLMLVDFKGGATLGPFARLPHCQALVTDLHPDTASRTLETLRAELLRRERLLAQAGAADYAAYRSQPGMEQLPRLVVMVDEFRVLTDEVPGALAELIRLAAVGRSLGLHLVLATQRPQGAVSAEMRANINAIVCLRLLSSFDSSDLLGTEAAARIPAERPGSALLKRGNGAPLAFQCAHTAPSSAGWTIVETGPALGSRGTVLTVVPDMAEPAPALITEDLASGAGALELPRNPFPPPLPERLIRLPRRHTQGQPPGAVPWGLIDLVGEQRQTALWWDPRLHRRTAVLAGPAAGGAQAVQGLASGLLRREPECHLYLLDGSQWLDGIAGAPRTAAHVGVSETDRVEEVFELLERAATPPAADRVLIVTGLAAWAAALGGAEFASFDDRLAGLARSAEPLGLAVVVVGDRDLASSRFFSLSESRLYCPYGLGPETVLTWPKLTPVRPLPGRAVWLSPGADPSGDAVQLVFPDPADNQVFPPANLRVAGSRPLPARVEPDELDRRMYTASPAPAAGTYALGLTGPDNRPWLWRPGRVALVLGRSGTGKTTALRRLVESAPVPAVFWSAACLDATASGVPIDPAPDGRVPQLVVVDDAAGLGQAGRLQLERWHAAGTHVAMSASPSPRLFTELPLASAAREPEAALLLNPRAASDADFLGWRVKPHRDPIPGRGYALVEGQLRAVQVACPAGDALSGGWEAGAALHT